MGNYKGKVLKAPLCKPGRFCFQCPYVDCIAPARVMQPTQEEAEMLAQSGITIVWAKAIERKRGV